MIRFIRFFYRGPGVVLVIVGGVIVVGWFIKQGQDKKQAEAEKHQVQRPLGQVKPAEQVDASQASKESVLSSKRLNPGFNTEPETTQIPNVPVSIPGRATALPQLVSFYAQVAPTPSPTPAAPERPKVQEIFLPPSIFIPCALINTVESSHINTPVVGEVIRDVYQNGHLIIPAGTIASSFAQSGAVRDRIEVAGAWLLVFSDGRQLKIHGIACDREADPENQQFGIEDGTAGLQGELVESDHWANAKAFLALLMTATTQTATAAATSALSTSRLGGAVVLPDTGAIQAKYLDQLLNGETGDGRFVRVKASTEFYIFPTDTILPRHRSVGDKGENNATEGPPREEAPLQPSGDPAQAAIQLEREMIRESQQQPSPTNEPKFKY
jgi:hypothetical protein